MTLGTPKHSSSPEANCRLSCPSLCLIFWQVRISLTLYNNSGMDTPKTPGTGGTNQVPLLPNRLKKQAEGSGRGRGTVKAI